jgi:hypothetical protein
MRGVPRLTERAKTLGVRLMLRSVQLAATAAAMMSATAAMAYNKSDYQEGVAMIKVDSRRNIRRLCSSHCARRSRCRDRGDRGGLVRCMDHIKTARAALSK